MLNPSQYGDTILLKDLHEGFISEKLERIHFKADAGTASYSEAWLQNLIMAQPGLLPLSQIEPVFANVVPVCTELPLPSGTFVDNLLITPTGDIALIECKLWRNPESRRKVLAQIIEYASEMTTLSYEELESSVQRARVAQAPSDNSSQSLFKIVSASYEMDEVAFHDSVSRNLKRGRLHLMIVGDGIREGLETLTEFLGGFNNEVQRTILER